MRPALFADLELATALERAMAERKLLLVDATASWCGPCQMMDRTTWVDAAVVAWFHDHALAIQVDVEEHKEIAQQLRIDAMPTIIAFVEGKEFDRVVGARKPKELLAWLEGVMRGETSLSVSRCRAQATPADMGARMQLARELTRAGRYDEALVEHVWLWEHMLEHEPAMYGVRMSFFAHDLERLISLHGPARAAIEALRDRAAPSASSPVEVESFRDWKCLNGVLGERSRSLAWYDALPPATRRSLGRLLERDIIPLLIEAQRWAEAGALYDQPLATVERYAAILAHEPTNVPAEMREHLRELHARAFRKDVAQVVRALCAARRAEEVELVARRALTVDPSEHMRQALAGARSS